MLGIQSGNSHGDCGTELTRFTPALLSPRFRQSVGTLVLRGKVGILSLLEDQETSMSAESSARSNVTSRTPLLYVASAECSSTRAGNRTRSS